VRPDSATRIRAPAALLVNAALDHFVIEVVSFARALADAGEHRITAVRLGDVVDQFHDQHGLADAGAAEQADLAALGVRREQIDDLDAGFENLRLGRLLGIGRRRLVNGAATRSVERAGFIDWLADYIDDAAQRFVADRHRDRRSGVRDRLAAGETLGRVHRDGAHGILAKMLRHFEHEAIALVVCFQRVQNFRQMPVELHVDDGADDLGDAPRG
jgi:peptide chain release factor 1